MKKGKNKKSEIKSAPLYAILGSAQKAGVNIRIMPLSLAKKKDDVWTYPSTGGTKHIPVKSLGLVDSSDFTNPDAIRKFYRGYCLKSGISKLIAAIKSTAGNNSSVMVPTVAVAKVKPAVSKASNKTVSLVSKSASVPAPGSDNVDCEVPGHFSDKDKQDIIAVNAILSGDKSKFSVLYKRYYQYINYMFSSGLKFNKEVADDLTADLFTKVFEKLSSYKPQYTFNSWISRVAKNMLLDYVRKEKTLPGMVSIDAGAASDKMHSEGEDVITMELEDVSGLNPEQEFVRNEKHEMLREAISKLDEKTRQLLLDFANGKTYDEICKETGIELNTVKSILFRGKAKLKDMIESNKAMYATI